MDVIARLSGCAWQAVCGVRGIGQVAKFLAARAEVRMTRALGSEQFGKEGADGNEVSK